ncbi:hypothetical protein HanXRQr2_Chr09g0395211 [Helianthus annuus]|uniref:Uncharacterized protein n=1 Tax=Helianthus annuus TaxID=4232 RepID=A0A9K3I7X4_HELAN|nr:hypothetical protein HanXRQr2_Chr09g0395211 [Helianthus annuus]KAJ0893723.1 hypothetical protein HanPSC8_Chr09g0381011 [Helianthus annuus]
MMVLYLLSTIITNNSNFQSNRSSFGSKRDLLIAQKLHRTRIIPKESKIVNLNRQMHNIVIRASNEPK